MIRPSFRFLFGPSPWIAPANSYRMATIKIQHMIAAARAAAFLAKIS
jgi:hypothetical protein